MRRFGHRVTGVDFTELPGIHDRVDRFVRTDLDQGLPQEVRDDGPYDVVVAADVLEHLRAPERLLDEIRSVLAPRGTLHCLGSQHRALVLARAHRVGPLRL